jgi:DNA primase
VLFPQRFIDDLRLQANIVQVVQDYVPLRRAGTKYKGLCPFHAEKTPSFHVDPEKGFFHCFGCHAGGDIFKFIELQEKVGFQDAVRLLAQKFGVALPEPEDGDVDSSRRDARLREELLKVHEVAAAFFREALAGAAGARARQQLHDRDVAAKTIEQLGLGYAPPGRDALRAALTTQGYSNALLVQSGLVVQRDGGEIVDRFRNRLMVPICRDTGSVVAFGGRAMNPDQQPKYLNSPETPIYSKSRTLYGLNLTKGAIRKLGYAVLVEGYFDFAQVLQTQAAPVVASCGTALTPAQAHLLRRFTTRVVLSYDPDAAGQGAAARSCELLVGEGFDVNVVVLDKGEDPDTFVRRKGPEAYRERLRVSRPYLEYLLDRAAEGVELGTDQGRRRFLTSMLTVAANIPDAAARDQFGDRIAHKARITEEVVRAEIRKAAAGRKTQVPSVGPGPGVGPVRDAERGLLWWLVNSPGEGFEALKDVDPEDLQGLATQEILELARTLQRESPNHLPLGLLQRLSTMNAQLVTRVAAEKAPPALNVGECVRTLKLIRWEREKALLQREIDRLQDSGADSEIDALLKNKNDLLHRIERLKNRPVQDTRGRVGAAATASGGGAPRGLMNVD